jgi:hypothetical protein
MKLHIVLLYEANRMLHFMMFCAHPCRLCSSSAAYMKNHVSSDKDSMDKFIVALTRGIHVRRHQEGCAAELVRLFSDDGCQSVGWEKVLHCMVTDLCCSGERCMLKDLPHFMLVSCT